MVICLERGADLRMAQLMPLPLTVSCFSKIQSGFTFLVLAHLGSPGKRAVKRVLNGSFGNRKSNEPVKYATNTPQRFCFEALCFSRRNFRIEKLSVYAADL